MPEKFYAMSPRHFSLMLNGYQDKQIDIYRQTRLLMFTMVRLMGDPKSAPKSPEAMWELPGDQKQGMTDEDMRELFKRFVK